MRIWKQVRSGMVSAIVLAAGQSRRMGARNKLLMEIDSQPMARHVVKRVLRSRAGEVVVVCGHQSGAVRAALDGLDATLVDNPNHLHGQSTSIQAGVRAASGAAAGYMICLGDLPGLEVLDYDRAIGEFERALSQDGRAIVRPVFGSAPGHPVVFSAEYRDELLGVRDQPGCRNVIRRHRDHVSEIPWGNDSVIRDVDTPQAHRLATRPQRGR